MFTLHDGQKQIETFAEKPLGDGAWVNGGYFVLEPKVIDYIDGDLVTREQQPMQKLAQYGQLFACPHSGFRQTGGRPPKFAEPSRPVTVTPPESTLLDLRLISPDRSRAIVKMTKKVRREDGTDKPLVEVVEMAKDRGLVIVGPSEALRRIPFLRFVEIAPARYLLAVDQGHNFHSLEVAIVDLLEDAQDRGREFQLMTELLNRIKGLRRAKRVSRAEILFVSLGDEFFFCSVCFFSRMNPPRKGRGPEGPTLRGGGQGCDAGELLRRARRPRGLRGGHEPTN